MKKSFLNLFMLILIYLVIYTGNNSAQIKNESDIEMAVQKGHSTMVCSLSFSPDGKYIVSGTLGKVIKLWNIKGRLIRNFIGDSIYNDNSIFFSPDSKHIIAAARNGKIDIWSIDGKLVRTFKAYDRLLLSMALSPDGKYIAVGGRGSKIKLWNIKGEHIKTIEESSGWVSFSPDGKYILSGDNLWSINGRHIRKIKDCSGLSSFSPDGKYIFSCGTKWHRRKDRAGFIKLFSYEGKLIKTLGKELNRIYSLSFSPDGKYIIISSFRYMRLIKIENDTCVWKVRIQGSKVSISPDGKYIVAGNRDGVISLWNMDGELIRIFSGYHHNKSLPIDWYISSGPDDKRLSSPVKIPKRQGRNKKSKSRTSFSSFKTVRKVLFSPDGKYIVTGSKLWRIDGKLIGTIGDYSRLNYGPPDTLSGLAFSPDSKYIVVADEYRGIIKLWNINGELIRTFDNKNVKIINNKAPGITKHSSNKKSRKKTSKFQGVYFDKSILFSPDGKYIASRAEYTKINLWSINGRLVSTLEGDYDILGIITFSPDSQYIAAGCWYGKNYGNGRIYFWNTDGELIRIIKVESNKIGDIIFSPDGKHIMAYTDDKEVKIWSIDGKLIKTFSNHSGKIFNTKLTTTQFSPDGKYVISFLPGNKKINDLTLRSIEGKRIRSFKGHTGRITCASFSPDSKYIISSSSDGTVLLHNVETGGYISLCASEDNNWIIYSPDGYFGASQYVGDLINVTAGVFSFGVDQFAIKNNRPDIILKRMGLGTKEQIDHFYNQYKKRLKRMGIKEDQLSKDPHVPEVKILETKQNGKFLEMIFKLSDKKYNLKKCNVYINDVPRYKGYGKDISGKFKKFRVKLELTSGKNKIEITCFNEKGAESYRALTYAEYNEKVKGDLYYIGFGVSKYKDKSLDLKYADKDAEDLAGLFSNMKDRYNNIHAKTYLNKEVTKENIRKAKEFLKNANVDDTFVLFIAGHGMYERTDEAAYYFLTHNADINNLSQTAANFDLLENLMQGIAPRNKLFLIDTCESGEIEEDTQKQYLAMADTRGIKARTTRALTLSLKNKGNKIKRTYLYDRDRYIYNDLRRRSGAIVFSSSRGGEFSYEKNEYQNGLFTEAIIKSLSGNEADEDSNGIISTDELRDYVIKTVPEFSDNLQHPTVDRDNIYQKFGFPIVE